MKLRGNLQGDKLIFYQNLLYYKGNKAKQDKTRQNGVRHDKIRKDDKILNKMRQNKSRCYKTK